MNQFLHHLAVTPANQLTLADLFGAFGMVLLLWGCFAAVPQGVAWVARKGWSNAEGSR